MTPEAPLAAVRSQLVTSDAPPVDEVPESAPARFPSSRRTWALVLLFSAVAGFAAWACEEGARVRFSPSFRMTRAEARAFSAKSILLWTRTQLRVARTRTSLVTFAALGAILAAALGTAGGLARRDHGRAAAAGAGGLALGAVLGAAASWSLIPLFNRYNDRVYDSLVTGGVTVPFLIQGGIIASIGWASGLALGFGLGGARRALRAGLGGILGATIAVVLYEFVGALGFSRLETAQPIPPTIGLRLFAHGAVVLSIAIGAMLAAQPLADAAKPALAEFEP